MPDAIRTMHITFFLNDRKVSAEVLPGETALRLLRERFGLTGTKQGCNEGDCGACTVAIGDWEDGGRKWSYKAYTSCLVPAARLHGRHVITIEGLAVAGALHPIQQAFLDHHATQCGFCTPGCIMSLFCLFSRTPSPSPQQIAEALEGNLCRCTGYEAIRDAGRSVAERTVLAAGDIAGRIVPAYCDGVAKQLAGFDQPVGYTEMKSDGDDCLAYHAPVSLDELFTLLWKIGDCADYRIVNGGTDVMVDANVKGARFKHLVDVTRLPGLRYVRADGPNVAIGANTTLADILDDGTVAANLPLLRATAARMASAQVRNAATLAGNLATASPIGDAAMALLALNATLVLATKMGERTIPVEKFYKGYRQTELCAHELITAIEVPAQTGAWDFQKSAKRAAVDISSVSSAMVARLDGKTVAEIRIACGGVAPTPVLLTTTMALLQGKQVKGTLVEQAAQAAAAEVAPISDVRGSKEFRGALVRNHVVKHLSTLL